MRVRELHEFIDRRRLPSEIGGHHKRPVRADELPDQHFHGIGRQRRRAGRLPAGAIDRRRRRRALQHLARGGQVDRALGIACRDLQGAVDDLLDVGGAADLVLVLDILTHDPALVGNVLQPVDEFVAAAGLLALLGGRRQAGEDEDGDAAARGVMQRAGQRLGAAIDMDDDRLWTSTHLGEAVGGGKRHHFVGAGDHRRYDTPGRTCMCDGFDQRRMVAAEIREDV